MRKRSAFTLVELMVAMALTIFIMLILTQAFVLSIETFVGLKGIGDMQENLRAAANGLRYDLNQPHFEAMRRTSDPNFNTTPPREGFIAINGDGMNIVAAWAPKQPMPFYIVVNGVYTTIQPGMNVIAPPTVVPPGTFVLSTTPNVPAGQTTVNINAQPGQPTGIVPVLFTVSEGSDLDSMPSTRSPFTTLHLTCRLRGNQQQSFYTATVADIPAQPNPPLNLPPFFTLPTFYNLAAGTLDADATLRVPATGPFFRSQWIEKCYFLGNGDPGAVLSGMFQPMGTTEEPLNPNGTGTPLYGLYCSSYVVLTDNTAVNNAQNSVTATAIGYPGANNVNYPKVQQGLFGNFAALACNADTVTNPAAPVIHFYNPNELAQGLRTFNAFRAFSGTNPGSAQMPQGSLVGPTASLVTPNVLSFQVQGIYSLGLSGDGIFYDTVNPAQYGTFGPLMGISITLRVWDNKTRQTRQLTIMQDL
jgi:type II secretory pathway pseudopilin PulG